jgi:N,N'-diacetyllegionaminate synthase
MEIVAEIAQGYEGDATLAKLLVRGAVRAGADAVKFQLVYADELATPEYPYYDLFRKLEMPHAVWRTVASEAKAAGVKLYFDVFGERSLHEAKSLDADGVKIHTTDFFNSHLVRSALALMPRVFISLGGISVEELKEFLDAYQITPDQQVCFMFGFQAEPTPLESNNLHRLRALKQRFPGYHFGFMDHSDGGSEDALALALLAIPFGLHCIEKHISLDRTLQIEDYVSALPPEQFKNFVQRVRRLEGALGTEDLALTTVEKDYRRKVMKVVVANREMRRGHEVIAADLSLKRVPQISASSFFRIEQVIGRILKVDVRPNQQITEDNFS